MTRLVLRMLALLGITVDEVDVRIVRWRPRRDVPIVVVEGPLPRHMIVLPRPPEAA